MYNIKRRNDGFAVWADNMLVIEDLFDTFAEARDYIHWIFDEVRISEAEAQVELAYERHLENSSWAETEAFAAWEAARGTW